MKMSVQGLVILKLVLRKVSFSFLLKWSTKMATLKWPFHNLGESTSKALTWHNFRWQTGGIACQRLRFCWTGLDFKLINSFHYSFIGEPWLSLPLSRSTVRNCHMRLLFDTHEQAAFENSCLISHTTVDIGLFTFPSTDSGMKIVLTMRGGKTLIGLIH